MTASLLCYALLTADPLAADFATRVRPLLVRYCFECHTGPAAEADLDLTRPDVRAWQRVGEQLDSGQMPPRDAKQPTDAERATLRGWVRKQLTAEARKHAGDPGRVPLRRLTNAEYTHTLRDLTGVPALNPAREFPVDGAAGEGFANTGDALSLSPALLAKYLDAAKAVAAHAVLTPDGLRFSPHTTRPDWTTETLDRIRRLYGRYSDPSGGSKVALQGLVWDGKEGGRLPVERYLAATLAERDALRDGRTAEVAAGRGLSAKYLGLVWAALTDATPSPLLDPLRTRWRSAGPADAATLAADIGRWQNALWKFNPVGHIGKLGGPTAWLEPVDPLATTQEVRWKVPTGDGEVTLHLATTGDGPVVWQRPRFVAPDRPELLLKDVRAVARARNAYRPRVLADTAKYLYAAAGGPADGLDENVLRGWRTVLGLGGPVAVTDHLTARQTRVAGQPAVSGWAAPDLPSVVANSSDATLRIPGELVGRSVAVHPSPTRAVVVGWQSPVAGQARVAATVRHAHAGCGNGVTWELVVRRGTGRERLAAGVTRGGTPIHLAPADVPVTAGEVLAVVVGPRDGNHACDLTAVDLTVTVGDQSWNLAKEVSADLLANNPHADAAGRPGVWHFTTEPADGKSPPAIPPDSPLGRWRAAPADGAAVAVQRWLTAPPASGDALHRRLTSLAGPLLGRTTPPESGTEPWGLDPERFDTAGDLAVTAPATVTVTVPADLVAGCEFVATGVARPPTTVAQLRLVAGPPTFHPDAPMLTTTEARPRLAAAVAAFRDLFPPAVCYARVVPVDEVVTLTLYHREDHHLSRLLLTDAERRELDHLWDELRYVSRDALAQVDAFQQLMEYATQDSDPKAFEPLRKPTLAAAAAFRKRLIDTEPLHLAAVRAFAGRAYRRPVAQAEADELNTLYRKLRGEGLPHDDAIRLTLARVLVAPAFLYRLERAGPTAGPVSDWELASRLSYFLWSSGPDAELRVLAAASKLRDPAVLVSQVRRMRADPKVRRLATEYGCQWLGVRGFDRHDEKSERHFPTFAGLRGAMDEEAVLFLTDFFQNDRPVSHLLAADATFLNEPLARHYGIPGVAGDPWRRVDGVRKHGRGGVLGLAATLAAQSGASRTSPILRGNWVSEVLLGEKLPKPPKGVPQLPDDEAATAGLTVRQLVERHTTDPKCAVCHRRIDAYGFALEGYDPIGRRRELDLGGRPVDVHARTADGAEFTGIDGLRDYLLTTRRAAFDRQFCRKLLGYALGRAVQLSDEPLLDELATLARDGRASQMLEAVVRSPQFRTIRGRDRPSE